MKKMRQILFNLSIGGTGGKNTCPFCAPGHYSLVSYFYKIIVLENLCFFNKMTNYTLTEQECLTPGPPCAESNIDLLPLQGVID